VHTFVAPFTNHGKLHQFGAEKLIGEITLHILTFLQ
jgi:hypothetical protein